MINIKIISSSHYATATPWQKLAFVATAKYNDRYIVKLETIVFADTIKRNQLQFEI